MALLLEKQDIQALVQQVGLDSLISDVIDCLAADFGRWQDFDKTPRVAHHYPHGVIELMPVSDPHQYSFKYVTGHPKNPHDGRLTVAAFGALAETGSGYPLLISEMTLLTAIRTAATSVFAAQLLARPESRTMALIGTGCQAEFQAHAFHSSFGITDIRYFDVDPTAMAKFARNLGRHPLRLHACAGVDDACDGADIISTVTADKANRTVVSRKHLRPGVHFNGVGGDCPGKTELAPDMLADLKIAVEYEPQSRIEGEIQALDEDSAVTELWQVLAGDRLVRTSPDDMTLFDSVGFALEDYSVLRCVYDLCRKHALGRESDLIFTPEDPKDLYSELALPLSARQVPEAVGS
ncbi:MAG: ornithine cyclodeaminase [Pseudomonadota bacterium]